VKIEFAAPFRRRSTPRTLLIESAPEAQRRAPRIARLLALAHKLDAIVRSGQIRDYAELASLGHISPARFTQIIVLLHLAPAIQERKAAPVRRKPENRASQTDRRTP
jgi:hypothetical protein